MKIRPIPGPLSAAVRVPGSKSLTSRALLVASLANGTTRLVNALFSEDTRYFAGALRALGFDVRLDEAAREMSVTGRGGLIPAARAELFIGNSGTAARFLCALLTLGRGEYLLDGGPRMRQRPIGDLVNSLGQLGAKLEAVDGCPPVKVAASGLRGGTAQITGDVSSQFISALLMIAPYAHGPVELALSTALNSRPYVEMTLAVMRDFGVEIERRDSSRFSIRPALYSPHAAYAVESDASAASYFFAASAVCGGTVRVENITRSSGQGDLAFLDVLERMGCSVEEVGDSIAVTGAASLAGVDADMRDIPDTAQTLAAIAPFASSATRIRGIASARFKETDRIRATCTELARLGVRVEEHRDGMTIHPAGSMLPACIQTYDDHRMAMAFSLIGLRFEGVTIEDPACVSKTFPGFFETLEALR
jgi:3-phosphoshikimate 1-carboxyvinyltransferase